MLHRNDRLVLPIDLRDFRPTKLIRSIGRGNVGSGSTNWIYSFVFFFFFIFSSFPHISTRCVFLILFGSLCRGVIGAAALSVLFFSFWFWYIKFRHPGIFDVRNWGQLHQHRHQCHHPARKNNNSTFFQPLAILLITVSNSLSSTATPIKYNSPDYTLKCLQKWEPSWREV